MSIHTSWRKVWSQQIEVEEVRGYRVSAVPTRPKAKLAPRVEAYSAMVALRMTLMHSGARTPICFGEWPFWCSGIGIGTTVFEFGSDLRDDTVVGDSRQGQAIGHVIASCFGDDHVGVAVVDSYSFLIRTIVGVVVSVRLHPVEVISLVLLIDPIWPH